MQAVSAMDILMDLSMLATVQLAYGSLRPVRLFGAAMFLAACTFLVRLFGLSGALMVLAHLSVLLLSAKIASGEQRPARILEAAMCMFCAGAAAAGFITLGGDRAALTALPGFPLLLFLLRRRRHEKHAWNIEVYVEKDGLCATLPALIDTGNRLLEHESGLPVFIAEAAAIPQIARYAQRLPHNQTKTLPFGVLGSTGEISCFMPDRLEIILPGTGRRTAPPCWVAVYPGRIPGSTRALAPPSFTKALESQRDRFKRHFIV